MNVVKQIRNTADRARRYFRTVGLKRAARELANRFIRSPADIRKARAALLGPASELPPGERALLKTASCRIHLADAMYSYGKAQHYFRVGLEAVSCIERARQSLAGGIPVRKVLDLPCGYGRVLRFLVQKYSGAAFTACDIDEQAVRFCSRTFKARPAFSSPDFDRLNLDDRYDLIWCGSLLTHIDERAAAALLRFFFRHLAAGGICVFTTLGSKPVGWIQAKSKNYGLSEAGHGQVVEGFLARGYGFAGYPDGRGLGIAAVTPGCIREMAQAAGLDEVFFVETGWDGHQDVYGFIPRQ